MKNILVCCDSFKECMSAQVACDCIEKGIKDSNYQCSIIKQPLADGGEGTGKILAEALSLKEQFIEVQGPMGNRINSKIYIDGSNEIALIEIADICGIDLVNEQERNPMVASTYGIGEAINYLIKKQVKKIYFSLGGSVTNDGGIGMLQALGAQFYNSEKSIIDFNLNNSMDIEKIDLSVCLEKLKGVKLFVLSDVNNVYCGKNGATYTFGKQKGATNEQLKTLELSLMHFNNCFIKNHNIDLSKIKMSGAAGGLAGALYLLGSELHNGLDYVMRVIDFNSKLQNSDLVITGEGSIDYQTKFGKVISGVINRANKYNIPVIAIGGRIDNDIDELYNNGLTAAFSITNEIKDLSEALLDGPKSLAKTTCNIFRLLKDF